MSEAGPGTDSRLEHVVELIAQAVAADLLRELEQEHRDDQRERAELDLENPPLDVKPAGR